MGGKGKDETEDAVFDFTSVSCLNVTLTYRNKCEPQPTNTYFDVISENRDHTSYAQKPHLKKVIDHPRFKEIALTKKYVEFHFDNASHFISEEFAFFILQDVHVIFPHFLTVSYFPFAPRHGKSICDRHFGKVSLWTGQFENNNTMSCVKDVMDAILNGQRDANKTRKLERKNEIEVYAIENKLVEPTGPQNKIIFPGLQSTHAKLRTN